MMMTDTDIHDTGEMTERVWCFERNQENRYRDRSLGKKIVILKRYKTKSRIGNNGWSGTIKGKGGASRQMIT